MSTIEAEEKITAHFGRPLPTAVLCSRTVTELKKRCDYLEAKNQLAVKQIKFHSGCADDYMSQYWDLYGQFLDLQREYQLLQKEMERREKGCICNGICLG